MTLLFDNKSTNSITRNFVHRNRTIHKEIDWHLEIYRHFSNCKYCFLHPTKTSANRYIYKGTSHTTVSWSYIQVENDWYPCTNLRESVELWEDIIRNGKYQYQDIVGIQRVVISLMQLSLGWLSNLFYSFQTKKWESEFMFSSLTSL